MHSPKNPKVIFQAMLVLLQLRKAQQKKHHRLSSLGARGWKLVPWHDLTATTSGFRSSIFFQSRKGAASFLLYPEDLKDPPSWKGERTCMTQGCLGPQNDASFEGPMILRVNEQKNTALARKDDGSLLETRWFFWGKLEFLSRNGGWKNNPVEQNKDIFIFPVILVR